MKTLIKNHSKDVSCVLSCYDRILIEGTLPELSHSQGITAYMNSKGIKIFEYVKFAEPLRDKTLEKLIEELQAWGEKHRRRITGKQK